MEKVMFSFLIDKELRRKLKVISSERDVSMLELMSEVIEKYLNSTK